MVIQSDFTDPETWIANLFVSQAAREGAGIRRKCRDVERYAGRDLFLDDMRRRGFSVVENAGQFVIFCTREPIRRLC